MLEIMTKSKQKHQFKDIQQAIDALENPEQYLINEEIIGFYGNEGSVKDKNMRELYKALKNHESITELDLSENNLDKTGADYAGRMIKHLDNLERVDLSGNDFGKYVNRVAKYARKHDNLKVLELSSNEIGNEGAEDVAKIIARSDTLKEIYLIDNQITKSGMKDILDAAEDSDSLTFLELSYNDCDHASKYVRDLLEANTILEKLYLDHSDLDSNDIKRILDGLEENSNLKLLSLEGHNFSEKYLNKLDEIVDSSHPHLTIAVEGKVFSAIDTEEEDDDFNGKDDAIGAINELMIQINNEINGADEFEIELIGGDVNF